MRPAYLRGGRVPHRTEHVNEDTDGHGNATRGTESPQKQRRECVLPGPHSDILKNDQSRIKGKNRNVHGDYF